MIIVDSSAIIAIAFKEVEARAFAEFLAPLSFLIAAPTLLETHMVLEGQPGRSAKNFFSSFLLNPRASIVPFDSDHATIARAAFDRYGKGRHPAQLNMGDCLAYACARTHGAALLFKGNDFNRTDITVA